MMRSKSSRSRVECDRNYVSRLSQGPGSARIAGRISLPVAGINDFLALRSSLEPLQLLPDLLAPLSTPLLVEVGASFDPLNDLLTLLEQRLLPEPSLKLAEGGYIADGVSQELDDLRLLTTDSKNFSIECCNRSGAEVVLPALSWASTRCLATIWKSAMLTRIGFLAIISASRLSNGERYITQELKEFEEKILSAEERSVELRTSTVAELRQEVHHNNLDAFRKVLAN